MYFPTSILDGDTSYLRLFIFISRLTVYFLQNHLMMVMNALFDEVITPWIEPSFVGWRIQNPVCMGKWVSHLKNKLE